ncbi:MAG TPA: 2-amino-4-hydroxy-6-hydroxymethyldihydropteridine diphosphokinase [Aggregatilineaceae bacterium]|nr:2-amino-4-hydroxy-6-hydroxymethyldihydropteridine diphosphokinase [Aggregatilineaceae bacterium]
MSKLDNPVPVFITLGSNIAPEENLPRAVRMLGQNHHLALCAVSRVYETAPLSANGQVARAQENFLNAAVLVETDYYTAFSLKYNVLRFLESCLGRVRSMDRFAARPIDLDIALFGSQVIVTPLLSIPDPDILRRAHVALPLANLAPEFVHPCTGQTLAAIADLLAAEPGITIRDDLYLKA